MANPHLEKVERRNTEKDFKGNVKVDDIPPAKDVLDKVEDYPLLDAKGKKHTFGSLWKDDQEGPRRVLVVFIRHFFCGNCQAYLRTLSLSLPPTLLSTLHPRTQIIVIGCGSPDLIPWYTETTSSPYPVYADPTRRLYDALQMTKSLALGNQSPEYMQRSIAYYSVRSFFQELRSGKKMLSGGDFRQVGGEFLFEGGRVKWCKRMRNTRDHAEIPVVRKQLGLRGDGKIKGGRKSKRWSVAGLSKGLEKRFTQRRQSWAVGRSRSSRFVKNDENPAKMNGMAEVKEEGETVTQVDALAKLEGKTPPMMKEDGVATTSGHASGARQQPSVAPTANGHAIEPHKSETNSVDNLTNGHATEPLNSSTSPAPTPIANGHATEPLNSSHSTATAPVTNVHAPDPLEPSSSPIPSPIANGHVTEPSTTQQPHLPNPITNGHAIEPQKKEDPTPSPKQIPNTHTTTPLSAHPSNLHPATIAFLNNPTNSNGTPIEPSSVDSPTKEGFEERFHTPKASITSIPDDVIPLNGAPKEGGIMKGHTDEVVGNGHVIA